MADSHTSSRRTLSPNIYLHHNELIRNKRRTLKCSRQELSKKLAKLSEDVTRPGVFNITEERIARIEAKESGELSLREAIAIAKVLDLQVGEVIAEDYHELLDGTEIGTYTKLHYFESDGELFSYFRKVEVGGRIGIYHSFPSSVYTTAFRRVCQEEIERANNIIACRVPSSEYYTIESLLLFALSEVGKFTYEQRRKIINKVIDVFSSDRRMHLYFFDDTYWKFGGPTDMEILQSILIVATLIPSYPVLEIKNHKVTKTFNDFFNDKESFALGEDSGIIEGDDAVSLLKVLDKYIEDGGRSVIGFCECCKEKTNHGRLILNQLPSLQVG